MKPPASGFSSSALEHRFLDKKEMDARSKELRAAVAAGIPEDELDCFRAAQMQGLNGEELWDVVRASWISMPMW